MQMSTLLTSLNDKIILFLVFPSIILLGAYLTFKLRCIQISKLKLSAQCLLKKEEGGAGNISHYQAMAAVLAGNFGTGNISGMAVALTTGGPGALVWMWVMAFLGAAIQYASCLLGVKHRTCTPTGEYVGGPMYYLEAAGFKFLAALFAVFTFFASLTVGNFAQINSVILPLGKMGLDPLLCGFVLAILVGLVIIGGIQRVAALAAFIIPIKALIYLGSALLILGLHWDQVLPALKLMFVAAFDKQALAGGVLGFGMFKALTVGFGRGIFATDAGTGIVPILQASARTKSPVIDGIVTLVAPFLVMIVCTATGLVLLVTKTWQDVDLKSTNMVTQAFKQGLGSNIGSYIVIFALVLFAYTTILAWGHCGEKAIGYLIGHHRAQWFKYVYIAFIPVGAILNVDLIWILADLSIAFMLLLNLVGVAALSASVIAETQQFFLEEEKFAYEMPTEIGV
jgi:AGCS family alanine or glycine:cation symporter